MFPELRFEDDQRLQIIHMTCGMRVEIRLNQREQKLRLTCPCPAVFSVSPQDLKKIEVASLLGLVHV